MRVLLSLCGWVIALPSVFAGLPEVVPPEVNPPDESVIQLTLHVESTAKPGGDGSSSAPFQAIQDAIEAANRSDEPVRIQIAPGTYRETLNIVANSQAEPPLLVIEAKKPGTVVISGSDEFSEWLPVPDQPGRFSHPWELNRGWEPNPWPGLMPMGARGFRHELLFLDGNPVRQVFEEANLGDYTYFVDETSRRLFLQLPEDESPNSFTIEVSVRPANDTGDHSKLIRIFKRDNVVLRGLVAQHGMSTSTMAAVQILGSSNLLIEDCRIEWNSSRGLAIETTGGVHPSNVVIRRTRCDNNGFAGIGGGFHDGLIEDVTANFNNWRGVMFGATGWAPCGWKFSGMDRVAIRRMQAVGNHASGGWFDDHITNVVIEDFTAMNNLRAGLSVEAVEGPLVVRNAFLAGNSVGFNLFDSKNVTLAESLIVDNLDAQVKLAGSLPMPSEELANVKQNWRKKRLSKRQVPTNILLSNNLIGVTLPSSSSRLLTFGMRDHAFELPDGTPSLMPMITTLTSTGAVYAHPDGEVALAFPDLRGRGITFDAWTQTTNQDIDARFDMDALKSARAAAEKKAGITITPYTAPDPNNPASSGADELEL